MSPDYIGPLTPSQSVEIRLGRFSRYGGHDSVGGGSKGPPFNPEEGGGHQFWDQVHYPCGARVGRKAGEPGEYEANPFYEMPWQALWIPTTGYVTIPNVASVKLDKKKGIGGIGTATIEIENIVYPDAGGYHRRERGYLSPLRAYLPAGTPTMPALLGEWEEAVAANEWKGRFAFAAQVTIHQGYGTAQAKTFTGLIEDLDTTSRPDKIILTCRDFGQVFTDEHFFGWNKDPVIATPVTFVDREQASGKTWVGYNANSSNANEPTHSASKVLDFNEETSWQTNTVGSPEQTEYVEIALPEGRYTFADIAMEWGGMEVFVALRAAEKNTGPTAPERIVGGVSTPMTVANHWLDKNGWVDPTKKEEQVVPGVNGGNSYTNLINPYPAGKQRTPIDPAAEYLIGANSVLRLSFRKLHAVSGGWRAGVKEFHGLREEFESGVSRAEWVTTEDIADVVRIICQWAGFKEWDIPDTGTRLPLRLIANPAEAYIDIIKRICEGIGYEFFMADPTPDGAPGGENSLGIPTFRKSRVISADTEAEREERANGEEHGLKNRGSKTTGLPNPIITDRSLLTAINLKQTNEALAYVIRVYGVTKSLPGDMKNAIASGKRLVYTFRPPWTGTPPTYVDSRLGGILKQVVHHDPLFSTVAQCRNAAWFIALQEALASVQATVEFPGYPGLDLDDHAQLMDLGTGISTRISVESRSSTFIDGEKRKWTMQIGGPLIDTPDVRDMVNIINFLTQANGIGNEWGDARHGTGSSLGYG